MGIEVVWAGRETHVWMEEGGRVIGKDEVGTTLEYACNDHHFLNFGGPPESTRMAVAVVVCDGVDCAESDGHDEDGVVLRDVFRLLHPLGHIHGGKSLL